MKSAIRINQYTMLMLLTVCMASLFVMNFAVLIFGTLFVVLLNYSVYSFCGDNYKIIKYISLSWFVGIIACIIIYYIYIIQNGVPYAMSDDYQYDVFWSEICLKNNYFSISQMVTHREFINHNSLIYVLFISYIQRICNYLGGYNTLILRMFNICLLNIMGIEGVAIAKKRWSIDIETERKILRWITLFPNAIFLSSHVYRDTIVTFLIVSTFLLWQNFQYTRIIRRIRVIIITAIIIAILFFLRSLAILFVITIVCLSIARFDSSKNKIGQRNLFKILFLGIVVIAVIFLSGQSDRFIRVFLHYTESRDSYEAASGSSFYAFLASLPFLLQVLLKVFYFALIPMYRQLFSIEMWKSPMDLIYAILTIGTFSMFFLYPYIFKMLKKLDSIALTLLIIFLSTAMTTAGFRHILVCYPFMFILGFAGREKSNQVVVANNDRTTLGIVFGMIGVLAIIR